MHRATVEVVRSQAGQTAPSSYVGAPLPEAAAAAAVPFQSLRQPQQTVAGTASCITQLPMARDGVGCCSRCIARQLACVLERLRQLDAHSEQQQHTICSECGCSARSNSTVTITTDDAADTTHAGAAAAADGSVRSAKAAPPAAAAANAVSVLQ